MHRSMAGQTAVRHHASICAVPLQCGFVTTGHACTSALASCNGGEPLLDLSLQTLEICPATAGLNLRCCRQVLLVEELGRMAVLHRCDV